MLSLSLSGRNILVTGGTQGIGEAVALAACDAGAAGIGIIGRNQGRGEAVAAELQRRGCKALFVPADLQRVDDCHAITRQALDHYGHIDGLVNAAGITDRGTIDNTSIELWDRMFAVNTRAPFILSQAAVAHWKAAGRPGSIVNIITMSSHGGQPFLTAYCASKGALATLTKNLAHALRRDRIRANGLNIGWTDTPGEDVIQHKDGRPDGWLLAAEAAQPFGRLIKPHDVATMAVYLLSDSSQMMTGALIDFDQNVIGAYD